MTFLRRIIYKFSNVYPFDPIVVAGNGKVGPLNQINHTSLVSVVTLTDCSKSACTIRKREFKISKVNKKHPDSVNE